MFGAIHRTALTRLELEFFSTFLIRNQGALHAECRFSCECLAKAFSLSLSRDSEHYTVVRIKYHLLYLDYPGEIGLLYRMQEIVEHYCSVIYLHNINQNVEVGPASRTANFIW